MSFVLQPESSSLAPDPHMINTIDSDQLLQAIPQSQIGQKIHAPASSPTGIPSRPTIPRKWPLDGGTGKRVTVTVTTAPPHQESRMDVGWFRSVLISSQFRALWEGLKPGHERRTESPH